MMTTSSVKFLILLNILGNLTIISSNSWMSTWMGLEMMTFSIPPLLCIEGSMMSKINSWKYLMIQSFSSSLIFISVMCLSFSSPNSISSMIQWMVLFLSILLKMGIFPFHGWMVQMSNSISWQIFMILSTLQKIGPLFILSEISPPQFNSSIWLPLSCFICYLSFMGMFYINSTRFFLITSSMVNTGWMIAATQTSKLSFLLFLISYIIHLWLIMSFLLKNHSSLESMIFNSKSIFILELMKFFISMSLVGVPPFLTFFTKILIMEELMLNNQLPTVLVLIFFSTFMMFIYISISLSSMMKMKSEKKQFKFFLPLSLSTVLLIMVSSIFFF